MTATAPHTALRFLTRTSFVLLCTVALAVTAASVERSATAAHPRVYADDRNGDLDGRDTREPVSHKPTVEAAFAAESYRAGGVARLVSFDSAHHVTLQLYRVGAMYGRLTSRDRMRGTAVGRPVRIATLSRGQAVSLPLGNWPSGLYFAQLTAPQGRIGYAPFVLAPRKLGTHRVAVVEPTQTWQAYNFRDDDGNGSSDTWYAGVIDTARLHRPFENRGVPPHYRYYDEPFLRWLGIHKIEVDVISDAELKATSGDRLARAYDLIVFPGHHEYVTTQEYDAVTRYRDLGGNLMFLSANNFFWKITIRGDVMTRVVRWRDIGRPEAALIGVQYYANDLGQHRNGWTVRNTAAGKWIFEGTGLTPGSLLSSGGIEADDVQAASPKNVQVLAEIKNLFGDGRNAQMTYYTTKSGAKVFAAGAFTLACSIWQPPVSELMGNLIDGLSRP